MRHLTGTTFYLALVPELDWLGLHTIIHVSLLCIDIGIFFVKEMGPKIKGTNHREDVLVPDIRNCYNYELNWGHSNLSKLNFC